MNSGPVVDWAYARECVGDDEELLRELVAAFLSEAKELLDGIRRAIAANDAQGLRFAAHTLKGSLRYFGATALSETVQGLENQGHAGILVDAAEMFAEVERDLAPIVKELAAYSGTKPPEA